MRRLVVFLFFTSKYICDCQEGSQYLQNAVRDLRKMNFRQTLRRADTKFLEESTKLPITDEENTPAAIERRVVYQNGNVPPLTLTKGELAALYENAVHKGETIKLNAGDNSYVHAAVAELDGSESKIHSHEDHSDDTDGYYYYYYPIKSFLDEMSSQPAHGHNDKIHFPSNPPSDYHIDPHDHYDHIQPYKEHHDDHTKSKYQYHSHHHEHLINISPTNKQAVEEKKPKAMEPLFMAISGFIGVAVAIALSVLMIPRMANPLVGNKKTAKHERISDIARIAISAIEGNDCTERFACELGNTARSFNLQENRFVKLLRRMAPSTFGKHIDKVGRYSNKRLKCTAIPCKKKPPKNKNSQKKNAQKKS
ncbi:unnamed protein product [Brassicogethes aeneus]|uniref:Uncharacterized protein n=1 Tax=Brassicogethes aeneus TaxID=1431903 RepID=A0A9P0BGK7_BRAAE|nr:unnamed protein product [Brassicogethes aeneus]